MYVTYGTLEPYETDITESRARPTDTDKAVNMTKMTVTEARDNLSDTMNRVAYAGERVILERNGKDLAVIISIEDLRLLEEIENRMDIEMVEMTRNEPATPWTEVKRNLRLKGEEKTKPGALRNRVKEARPKISRKKS